MTETAPLRLEYIDAEQLADNPLNWRCHGAQQLDGLKAVIDEVGWAGALLYNERTERLIDGHARKKVSKGPVPVLIGSWSEEDEQKILATLDPLAAMAEANEQALGELLAQIETESDALQEMLDGLAEEHGIKSAEEPAEAPEAQIDRADELRETWQTERGQLWVIPSKTDGLEHRLSCGDSTCVEDVGRLMGDTRAVLVHADPPYGMGKENEGVANDNLYQEKLDAFQMSWWATVRPHVEDNGSAYIWGNAEDLWRLWYRGGLKESERLTLRNFVTWNKPPAWRHGFAPEALMKDPSRRCFLSVCEHILFFMLGEQGFNNNADNYWEGWEPIRAQLAADCEKMGWGAADIRRICGVGMHSHWFTKSQWAFIPEEHYQKLQAAAREHDAFKREHDDLKREHDDLKREFYATRAYFDNTHENMTDVWDFPRVTGEERHGHPTPKPVAMIERAIKTSSREGDIVLEPFVGSGTTMVAAERTGRVCYGAELDAGYAAVTLQRLADMGLEPRLSDG